MVMGMKRVTRPLMPRTCLDCKLVVTGTNWNRHPMTCTGPEHPIVSDEDTILRLYWLGKRRTYKNMFLSYTELYSLVQQAGIQPSQIGQASSDYQLARYDDSGDYVIGNCRFITTRENIRERDSSASVDNIRKAREVKKKLYIERRI